MNKKFEIEGVNLSKVYKNNILALDSISFTVNKGTVIGVIGRNGSGKTTLFKIISGVISDFTGKCYVDGKPVSLDYSERISYLPETRGLDDRMQVLEHVTDLIRYKGITSREAGKSAEKWLEYFDLSYSRYQKIGTLSKGNQQKLQFIVAIASNPKLLILDEPFSGLDPITSDIFWEVIDKFRAEGNTVIFSSHTLNDKMSKCDEFIFLNKGRIIETGTLDEVQSRYKMVLEVKNATLDKETLISAFPNAAYAFADGKFSIQVESLAEARKIYNCLEEKFSEIFCLRKMTLEELFREINLGADDDENN